MKKTMLFGVIVCVLGMLDADGMGLQQAKEEALVTVYKYPNLREYVSAIQEGDRDDVQACLMGCIDRIGDYGSVEARSDIVYLTGLIDRLSLDLSDSAAAQPVYEQAEDLDRALAMSLQDQGEASVGGAFTSYRAFAPADILQMDADLALAMSLQEQTAVREELPRAEGELAASLGGLIGQFEGILKAHGTDFDVHTFDALFAANQVNVERYLTSVYPIDRAMTLDDIRQDMSRIIAETNSTLVTEHDLSEAHLARALLVLQSASHSVLIPMFRQVYTVACRYTPNMKQSIVISFLSNVNKFKGAECFPGFRNRIISDFCRLYRGNRPL